jgi:D-alanyl-D-alanine dipeptidase
MLHYYGMDARIGSHLRLLQTAMGRNGFYGLHTEWWHFSAKNWRNYVPSSDMQMTGPSPKSEPNGKL